MQIVNRPRKKGPSKNVMPLSHEKTGWTAQQLRSLGAELYSLGAKIRTTKLKSELDSAKTLITWSKRTERQAEITQSLVHLKQKSPRTNWRSSIFLEEPRNELLGQHKLSSLGQGPSMSPGGQGCIIGSAEALPILCVRCARWEREIQRKIKRERERERERRKWRHLSSAEIGDEFCIFPCQKFAP